MSARSIEHTSKGRVMEGSYFSRLGVNVAAVIIGALVLLIALAWIEVVDALSNQVFFDDHQEGRRYDHELKKKFLSALAVTVLSVFIVIIVLVYYTQHSSREQPAEKSYEAYYNFPSVHGITAHD